MSRALFFLPHNLMSTDLELMFTVFKLMSIALELMFTACKHKFSRYRDTFFLVIANNRIKSPKQPKSHQIICVIQYFSVFLQTNEIINQSRKYHYGKNSCIIEAQLCTASADW